jgi:hypothetical protein
MLHTMQVPVYSNVNLEGVCDSIRVVYFNQVEMGFAYIKSFRESAAPLSSTYTKLKTLIEIICDETTYQRLYSLMQSVRNEGAITALEKTEMEDE